MLQFCKFAPEAQENLAIFSLKYGHRAIQNGGRGADGGGAGAPLASLDPPLRSWAPLASDTSNNWCKHSPEKILINGFANQE